MLTGPFGTFFVLLAGLTVGMRRCLLRPGFRGFFSLGGCFDRFDLAGLGIHHNFAKHLALADGDCIFPLSRFILQWDLANYLAVHPFEGDGPGLARAQAHIGPMTGLLGECGRRKRSEDTYRCQSGRSLCVTSHGR